MKYFQWRIFFLIFTFLGACVSSPPIENLPDVGIPYNKLNKDLYLTAPIGWNTFKTSDPIAINIKVTSSNTIVFQPDFGVRIFLEKNDSWDEIFDDTKRPGGLIHLSPESSWQDYSSIVLYPDPFDRNDKTKLRIYIIGKVYRNGQITDELVGSYVDINLTP